MRDRSRRRGHGGHRRRGPRPGAALVAALALLALASAIVAGSFAASSAAARATRSASASVRVQGGAQGAVASVLSGWGPSESELAVGASLVRPYAGAGAASRLAGRTRVHRLSAGLYAISSDLVAGDSARPDARRRVRLLVVSVPAVAGQAGQTPVPLRRWALSDVY